MSKYPANKIFPTKIKKAIFWSYVSNTITTGYQYIDIAGKPFSQIDMYDLFSRCINAIFIYVESVLPSSDIPELLNKSGFNYEEANTIEQCNYILENEEVFRDFIGYGGIQSDRVIDFIPKYLEIIDILRSGEVYKGLKMN